jgi:hypothetical protein
MKRTAILLLSVLLNISFFTVRADAPNWGSADTVESHLVGPGIEYTKIIYHSQPLILWWTVIDLQNPYNKVEESMSRHQVPDVKRWDIATHYKENSWPGHHVKVAWNHDFFVYDDGICIGQNISNGEETFSLWGRSLLAITKDKKAEVFNPNTMTCAATAPDGTSVALTSYNSGATYIAGNYVLFNHMNSRTLTDAGRYFELQPLDEWIVNGHDIRCKVLNMGSSPIQTSGDHCVLYFRNEGTTDFDGHVNVGDTIRITQKFTGATWGTPPADIFNGFHGYPSLAHDGVLHDGEYNDFENGREYEKSSHVLAGISKDKTKLFVLLNEMSAQSNAVDCVDLTNWMLAHGAWDVVNFDSGGSAAIAIDGNMLNLPGRGAVRPIEDAMLAVSLAPDDSIADHITFSRPYISPTTISLTPLRVLLFNKYDEVLSNDLAGCTFTCSPSEMGYVDDNAVFHSGVKGMNGTITAEKDGKTATLLVGTRTANNVRPAYTNILINDKRHYQINVSGENGGDTFSLDPAAFNWTSSDADCCTVDDGILIGRRNGTAELTATFDTISFKINATVEIPTDNLLKQESFADTANITFSNSGVKNLHADANNLPAGWTDGEVYNFDITSSRVPTMALTNAVRLYSLPDSVTFKMHDATGIVKTVNVMYHDALGTSTTLTFTPVAEHDSAYCIPLSALSVPQFPVTIRRIQFNMQSAKVGTGYQIALGDLFAHYAGGSGVKAVKTGASASPLRLINGSETVKAVFSAERAGRAVVSMYTASGQLLSTQTVATQSGVNEVTISTKQASCGFYIVTVSTPQATWSAKCSVR